MKNLKLIIWSLTLFASSLFLISCDDDAPKAENEEEIITDVVLTFTPTSGGTPVVATAQDPDGEGPQNLQVKDNIILSPNTTYTLTIDLKNTVANKSITEEVQEESAEHMLFYGWTNAIFTSPEGDGNIDNRTDPVNYLDKDLNDLPLGLTTSWTTGNAATGTFRLILKHQPGTKSATSSSEDGETDLDISWNASVE